MRWKKLGLVIRPDRDLHWSRTHAMVPTPLALGNGIFRIYFSGRDDANRSNIGWAVIDLERPDRLLDYSQTPVLCPGALGCFDDNGVTPSCAIRRDDGRIFLYYLGWNPGSTVRMHLFGGLAVSEDDGMTFRRWSQAPILERGPTDPYLNTAPWVVRADNEWRMYYVCGTGWRSKDEPLYHIRLARSEDGCVWRRDGHVCIDFASREEVALARPYVYREAGKWKMWFAHKGSAYRLGYAESTDGLTWQRLDHEAGLDVTPGAFDSEMVEYAAVVAHEGRRYMFYNGNNYGYDGIGLAVSEAE